MKDEIKEILDKLKNSVDNPIDTEVDQFTQEAYDVPNYFCLDPTTNDCKLLYDYITNLQQERDKFKSRLDKANEIIDEVLFVGVKNYRSQLEIVQKVINGGDEE